MTMDYYNEMYRILREEGLDFDPDLLPDDYEYFNTIDTSYEAFER